MSKGDNSPGMSRLAGVLRGIADGQQDKSLVLDIGTIQGDKSLLTNTYPIPIPKSDYLVCRSLKARYVTLTSDNTTINTHVGLKVGDRVLVAWVLNDAVVVDVIISADDVF